MEENFENLLEGFEVVQNNGDEYDITTLTPGVYYPREKKQSRFRKKRHKHERAVYKNGHFNIDKYNDKKSILSMLPNWFITLVETRWRWTILSFAMGFTGDWMLFGLIYWTISITHGDLLDENLPPNQNRTGWNPCIEEIYGFTSTFLFSVEVHTTVAYGRRSVTLECPQAIFAMCIQCIVSSILQAFMVGILFAKLTRPKARTQTILFTKNAVVNKRDEKLCLIFRVGDIRKSRIVDLKAAAYLIRGSTDAEEPSAFDQIKLNVEIDGCDSIFFLWPVSVVHVIDKHSPFYNLSAADLLCGTLEVLVVIEGTIESTGQPVQARSSYIETEILWGHRLVPMVEFDDVKYAYDVDFSKLSETEQVDTPLCSAEELEMLCSEIGFVGEFGAFESLKSDCEKYLKTG